MISPLIGLCPHLLLLYPLFTQLQAHRRLWGPSDVPIRLLPLRTDSPLSLGHLSRHPHSPLHQPPLEISPQTWPSQDPSPPLLIPSLLYLSPYHLPPSNTLDNSFTSFVYCLSHPTGMEVTWELFVWILNNYLSNVGWIYLILFKGLSII